MKKNLPSPTRRSVVEIRVNKLQANPASDPRRLRGGRLSTTETERRSPLVDHGAHHAMRLHNEGNGGQQEGRRRDEV